MAMDKEVQSRPRQRGRIHSGGCGQPRVAHRRREQRPPLAPRPGIFPEPQIVPRPLVIPGSARRLTPADFEHAPVSEHRGVIRDALWQPSAANRLLYDS